MSPGSEFPSDREKTMKKVILTGAGGNLGQEIIKTNAFEFIEINRNNWMRLDDLKPGEIDFVIHTAYDLKNKIKDNTTAVIDSNITTTAKILEICRDKKISNFVFISSCAVYGDSSNSSEDKPCTPITMNGYIKHFNEELIKNFCDSHKINYLILRAFNSYGGNDHFSVLNKLISCAKNNEVFTLINKGIAERDFIHIRDVAKLTCILASMDLKNEIINIGSGQSVKISDLLAAVENKFGTIKVKHIDNENEAVFSRANIKKLNKLVSFKPISIFDFINYL